jgi:hypothetical protein
MEVATKTKAKSGQNKVTGSGGVGREVCLYPVRFVLIGPLPGDPARPEETQRWNYQDRAVTKSRRCPGFVGYSIGFPYNHDRPFNPANWCPENVRGIGSVLTLLHPETVVDVPSRMRSIVNAHRLPLCRPRGRT